MKLRVTRRSGRYVEVWRGGDKLSQHLDVTEAMETSSAALEADATPVQLRQPLVIDVERIGGTPPPPDPEPPPDPDPPPDEPDEEDPADGESPSIPEPVAALIGPQLMIGESPWPWFDENAVSMGHQHGRVFPASPVGQDYDLYLNRNYYDQGLCQYINYYRTGDAAFLGYARKIADSWWQLPNIDQGQNRNFDNSLSPRGASLFGLILRALDGRPELWPWITDWARYMLNVWVLRWTAVTELRAGLRDGGYMLTYAAWIAQAHPDAAVRAEFRANAIAAARDYFVRLQYADGSWRWQDEAGWPASERRMMPFMVGLLLEGLIEVHQMTDDAAIATSIAKGCEALMRDAYRGAEPVPELPTVGWRAMWYTAYDGGPTGDRHLRGGTDTNSIREARENNSTCCHAFGYAYQITGDVRFRQWGDELFAATFGKGEGPGADAFYALADYQEKQYAQNYRSAGRYLAWRL